MYVCMYTYIHTYIHTSMHACMHACIHTYIHTYIHIYIYIYIYIYDRGMQICRHAMCLCTVPVLIVAVSQLARAILAGTGQPAGLNAWRLEVQGSVFHTGVGRSSRRFFANVPH